MAASTATALPNEKKVGIGKREIRLLKLKAVESPFEFLILFSNCDSNLVCCCPILRSMQL